MLRLLFLLIVTNALGAQTPPASASDALHSAYTLFKQGKFKEAAAAYQVMVEKDPRAAVAYSGLIQSYLKADNVSAADQALAVALQALPKSALIQAARGDVEFRRGLFAEAERDYTWALQLDQKCARAWVGMGKIDAIVSHQEEAKEAFTRAHNLDPEDGDALYRWAVLLPFPQSVNELERHLSEYRSTAEEERREREFIDLVNGIGDREVWVPQNDLKEAEIKLETIAPRVGIVAGEGLKVKFNGSVTATLLLDTGSTWMTIPHKLAEKIGARKISDYGIEGVGNSGPATGYFAWVDKIRIGPVEFHNCVVHVANKGDLGDVDGIAGTNIFFKYRVTLDFPRHKLQVAQSPPHIYLEGRPESLVEHAPGAIFAFGHILLLRTLLNNSSTALFVLDTGANRSSISPRAAKGLGNFEQSANYVTGLSGNINNVPLLPDATLKFSAAAAVKRDLLIFDADALSRQLHTEVSGFIGFDVLGRMGVTIDYPHGQVSFEKAR